jgi:uncharacterized protein YbjT (DUF2867 family)
VQQLLQLGVTVHAHVRPDSASREKWVKHFQAEGAVVDSTPWDAQSMRAALKRIGSTHVFSLLGTTRSRARADKSGRSTYDAVDYRLTALLLDAASTSGTNPRFVYLSSLGATISTSNQYLRVRGLMEKMIRDSGLPYVIVQPAIITGPDRDEVRLLEPASAALGNAVLRVIALFGGSRLRARYSSMTGRDLAHGIVHFAMSGPAQRGSGITITYEEIRQHAGVGL